MNNFPSIGDNYSDVTISEANRLKQKFLLECVQGKLKSFKLSSCLLFIYTIWYSKVAIFDGESKGFIGFKKKHLKMFSDILLKSTGGSQSYHI